jgi:hypothetical protein
MLVRCTNVPIAIPNGEELSIVIVLIQIVSDNLFEEAKMSLTFNDVGYS